MLKLQIIQIIVKIDQICTTSNRHNYKFASHTGLEPMIYHIQGEHTKHYTTDAIRMCEHEELRSIIHCYMYLILFSSSSRSLSGRKLVSTSGFLPI
jgi:hypothetical protein